MFQGLNISVCKKSYTFWTVNIIVKEFWKERQFWESSNIYDNLDCNVDYLNPLLRCVQIINIYSQYFEAFNILVSKGSSDDRYIYIYIDHFYVR